MAYKKTNWTETTPIDATNLQKLEDGLEELSRFSTADYDSLPVGSILPFSSTTLPTGYLLCDGSAISRTDYASLFEIIGTKYGAGDGTTTFNLPNLKGKVPVGLDSNDTSFNALGATGGEKTHTLTVDEMPSHTHSISGYKGEYQWADGQLWFRGGGYNSGNTEITHKVTYTGGSQSHNNLQPYQVVNYIIKASGTAILNGDVVDSLDGNSTTNAPSINAVNRANTYSTEEVKTGKTWIDGKPIYRKTFTGDISSYIAHGLTNVNIIQFYGISVNNNNITFNLPSIRPAYPEYAIGVYINATDIVFEIGSGANGTAYITLEYTKNGD